MARQRASNGWQCRRAHDCHSSRWDVHGEVRLRAVGYGHRLTETLVKLLHRFGTEHDLADARHLMTGKYGCGHFGAVGRQNYRYGHAVDLSVGKVVTGVRRDVRIVKEKSLGLRLRLGRELLS